jgi:hypothetical protein
LQDIRKFVASTRQLTDVLSAPARQHLDAEPRELVVAGVNGSRSNFDSFDEAFGERGMDSFNGGLKIATT